MTRKYFYKPDQDWWLSRLSELQDDEDFDLVNTGKCVVDDNIHHITYMDQYHSEYMGSKKPVPIGVTRVSDKCSERGLGWIQSLAKMMRNDIAFFWNTEGSEECEEAIVELLETLEEENMIQ